MIPGQSTLFVDGALELDDDQRADLAARRIRIETEAVVGIAGAAPEICLRLRDGRVCPLDGLFVLSTTRPRGDLAEQLGCGLESSPFGAYIKTDATKETTVPGVFACGDASIVSGAVSFAVAEGARAGVSAHQSLVFRR